MVQTVNSESVADDQLRAFIERIERLEDEKKAIADDIREVKAEAKGNGFSVPVLNEILKLRKKDHADRMEFEALLDLYMSALGMQTTMRFDDDDEGPRRSANLSSGRAPSVAEPSLRNPQTTIRPGEPADTGDRGAHALSSVSNSADEADEGGEGIVAFVLHANQSTAVHEDGLKSDDADGSPPSISVPARDVEHGVAPLTNIAPVDTHSAAADPSEDSANHVTASSDQTTEVTPAASVVDPIKSAREGGSSDSHVAEADDASAAAPLPGEAQPFTPKPDGRPRNSKGIKKPIGCRDLEACHTIGSRAPCSGCAAKIAQLEAAE